MSEFFWICISVVGLVALIVICATISNIVNGCKETNKGESTDEQV